jgi:collagenase-like PrtC family protease
MEMGRGAEHRTPPQAGREAIVAAQPAAPEVAAAGRVALAVGPLLTYWPRRTLIDFYGSVAELPVATVTLGEVVCSRRHEMKVDDWLALARDLAAAGKEVVLATQALIESEAELRTMHRLADQDEFLVEANEAAALGRLAGRPFVIGPHVNVYSAAALDELAALGAVRWVPPVEVPVEAMAAVNPAGRRPPLDTEVFAFGRMPLAISARCFTARHYGVNRDECGFRCIEHPDGLALRTQEGEPFLALNGLQALSARLMCALPERDALAAANVRRLRLSPISAHFDAVVRAFDRVFGDGADPLEEARQLAALQLPGALADGYLRREAGIGWSCA